MEHSAANNTDGAKIIAEKGARVMDVSSAAYVAERKHTNSMVSSKDMTTHGQNGAIKACAGDIVIYESERPKIVVACKVKGVNGDGSYHLKPLAARSSPYPSAEGSRMRFPGDHDYIATGRESCSQIARKTGICIKNLLLWNELRILGLTPRSSPLRGTHLWVKEKAVYLARAPAVMSLKRKSSAKIKFCQPRRKKSARGGKARETGSAFYSSPSVSSNPSLGRKTRFTEVGRGEKCLDAVPMSTGNFSRSLSSSVDVRMRVGLKDVPLVAKESGSDVAVREIGMKAGKGVNNVKPLRHRLLKGVVRMYDEVPSPSNECARLLAPGPADMASHHETPTKTMVDDFVIQEHSLNRQKYPAAWAALNILKK
jgi:hypothetical protein